MKKNKIRYRLYIQNPETKKWIVSITTKTLDNLAKKMAFNLQFNSNWYTDKQDKPSKLKLVCEEVKGKKIIEIEKYKITKDWKIKGFFQWDKLKET